MLESSGVTHGQATRNVNGAHRGWLRIAGVLVALVALTVSGLTLPGAVASSAPSLAAGQPIHSSADPSNVTMRATSAPPSVAGTGPLASYGYYEKLYHLPGYAPMSSYLNDLGGADKQIPTLTSSSTQVTGIYYVDNSSNFDILYLNNSTVRAIAHIIPLYQRYAYNEMLDNEFFVEYGYDQALFFGTTTLGGRNYSIELVNLETGSLRMWNTTAAVDSTNQQPVYVGNNTVVVVSSNNSIIGYNLASHERWRAGTTSYFEANNIYWVPQVEQLINVEARGSTGDRVQQLNATYDSLGRIRFSIVVDFALDSGVQFNFVNGIGFNASARQLTFSAGYFRGDTVYTYVLQYLPSYVLSVSLAAKYTVLPGDTPLLFTGQRYVYTSDYVIGGNVGGIQYLFDPWTGAALPTNRTFQQGVACANACFEGLFAPSQDYMLDYNASLRNESAFYNVVYAYHDASSPYPLSVPTAPTELSTGSVTSTTVPLAWTNPTGTLTGDVVLQAAYTTSCGAYVPIYSPHSVFSSFTVTNLSSGNEYCFEVEASNPAGNSSPSVALVIATITGAPLSLTWSVATAKSIALTWTPPVTSPSLGVIDSYTVLQASYTGSCGSYSTSYAEVSDPYTVTDLISGSFYCFEVEAVDGGGTSAVSSPVNTAAPKATLMASPTTIDYSQQTSTLTLAMTGGARPYLWTLEVNGSTTNITGASTLAYTFAPAGAGFYTFYLNVTGSNGDSDSVTAAITVDPALVVPKPTSSSNPMVEDQETVISTALSGGSAPYVTVWHNLPTGCSTSDADVLDCTPTGVGTYSVFVTVTDAAGVRVASGSLSITVSKRSDSMNLSCPTSDVDVGTAETCSVTLTDTSPGTAVTPTGKIMVMIRGPSGFSALRTCTLVGRGGTATCHVTFTPSRTGTYTVTASYPGDSKHVGRTATVTLTAGPSG